MAGNYYPDRLFMLSGVWVHNKGRFGEHFLKGAHFASPNEECEWEQDNQPRYFRDLNSSSVYVLGLHQLPSLVPKEWLDWDRRHDKRAPKEWVSWYLSQTHG